MILGYSKIWPDNLIKLCSSSSSSNPKRYTPCSLEADASALSYFSPSRNITVRDVHYWSTDDSVGSDNSLFYGVWDPLEAVSILDANIPY